ncbi:MAG: hypothetical protein LBJ77_02595 [Holosporales bacterium]|nr:hypothetical protein [Holosporales bacterium]
MIVICLVVLGSFSAATGAEIPRRKSNHRFTPEEDNLLRSLVQLHPDKINWKLIAAGVPGRTGRQCRDRWVQFLSPTATEILPLPLTPPEISLLESSVEKHGHQWEFIARLFPWRNASQLKYFWGTSPKANHDPINLQPEEEEAIIEAVRAGISIRQIALGIVKRNPDRKNNEALRIAQMYKKKRPKKPLEPVLPAQGIVPPPSTQIPVAIQSAKGNFDEIDQEDPNFTDEDPYQFL